MYIFNIHSGTNDAHVYRWSKKNVCKLMQGLTNPTLNDGDKRSFIEALIVPYILLKEKCYFSQKNDIQVIWTVLFL